MNAFQCVICDTFSNPKMIYLPNMPDSTFEITEKKITLTIAECPHCGAVQLINTPLSANYQDVYRSIGISKELRQAKKNQLQLFIDKYHLHSTSMIEIGCGDGQFLEIFKDLGKDVHGTETNLSNYNTCREKGFNVVYGAIYDLDQMYGSFGCFHYLEHIPNPQNFIRELYDKLCPGAIGIIEVPNYDYIEAKQIWLEFTKDHRVYYRKRTIEYFLTNYRFEILSIEENEYDKLVLTVIVRKPMPPVLTVLNDQFKSDIAEFEQYCSFLAQPFVIYGAGHYCQLMLNNTNVKPLHIFDSNPQKCGKKMNGILVEHKDTMQHDFKSILVMCGIYNSEIVKMLKQMNRTEEIVAWKN